jgi:hypothetical protein
MHRQEKGTKVCFSYCMQHLFLAWELLLLFQPSHTGSPPLTSQTGARHSKHIVWYLEFSSAWLHLQAFVVVMMMIIIHQLRYGRQDNHATNHAIYALRNCSAPLASTINRAGRVTDWLKGEQSITRFTSRQARVLAVTSRLALTLRTNTRRLECIKWAR